MRLESLGPLAHMGLGFLAGALSVDRPDLSALITGLFIAYQAFDYAVTRDRPHVDLLQYALPFLATMIMKLIGEKT